MARDRVKTVLCIGDDPIHLNFRCSSLKENGWAVLSSGSGYDGIKRFDREDVDTVVIDLNNSGSDAALVCGALKGKNPGVPIVVLVADQKAMLDGATELADATLSKSLENSQLSDLLDRLIRRH